MSRNQYLRSKIQRRHGSKKEQSKKRASLPTQAREKKRAKVETVVYDSDDSDYYLPSQIKARILKEQEEEAARKRKHSEEVEKLSYFPSCWISLGILPVAKSRVESLSRQEQVYYQTYSALKEKGIIDECGDPENEIWEDPMDTEDKCDKCEKPHVFGKSDKLVLMQRYAEQRVGKEL